MRNIGFNVRRLGNDDLLLTAGNQMRCWLSEHRQNDTVSVLWEGLESYWANGGYEPFDAGDANPFVGLSSAPCIAEAIDIDDDGKKEIVGEFWFFGDYQVIDPIAELRTRGRVIFSKA